MIMLPPYFRYLVFALMLEPRVVHSQSLGVLPLVPVVARSHDGHVLITLTPGEAVVRHLTLLPPHRLLLDDDKVHLGEARLFYY